MAPTLLHGKIVMVSQCYAPDPSPTATYITEIANGLSEQHDVVVISGTAHSGMPGGGGEPFVMEVRTRTPEKAELARRAIAALLFSVNTFFATLKHVTKDDVVLCVTTPFTAPYFVTLAAKLRGALVILLIHDLYPDALAIAGLAKSDSLIARAIRLANGHLFRTLDAIITIGRDVEARLLTYRGVDKAKIKFIPNWTRLRIGYREAKPTNKFRSPFGDKFVVGLSGNLGFTHSAETVYEATRVLAEDPSLHMLFSGWGVGWKQLTELYAANPIGNVTLVDPVPESDLEEFLSAGDVWIIPYRRHVAGVSVPSRIYNLLAVGRAVIVTSEANSEAALMLREQDIGWVARPEDPGDLAATIRLAASDRDKIKAKGHCAALVAQRYTYALAIDSYRKVVNEVSRNREAACPR
jgi:colanic acid biosynthesis glycosyl transferase WcaI